MGVTLPLYLPPARWLSQAAALVLSAPSPPGGFSALHRPEISTARGVHASGSCGLLRFWSTGPSLHCGRPR